MMQETLVTRLSYLTKHRLLYDNISRDRLQASCHRLRHTTMRYEKFLCNRPTELKSYDVGQQFYDTATGAIRDFKPINNGEVSVYYCGASVQGRLHGMHIRSAVMFDSLVSRLEYDGTKVTLVLKVTDLNEKMLSRSYDAFMADFVAT